MKNYTIDNSCEADLDRSITWQYDNAENLIGIIGILKDFSNQAMRDFWDAWPVNVVDIDTADDFGLSIWGKILNVARPEIELDGVSAPISTEAYRKILKARFALINSQGTIPDYIDYINAVFDGKCSVTDGHDMSMTFVVDDDADSEMAAIAEQSPKTVFVYPAGVDDGVDTNSLTFALAGQVESTSSDPKVGGLDESSFTWR